MSGLRRATITHDDGDVRIDLEQTDGGTPFLAMSKLDGSERKAMPLSSAEVALLIGFLSGSNLDP